VVLSRYRTHARANERKSKRTVYGASRDAGALEDSWILVKTVLRGSPFYLL